MTTPPDESAPEPDSEPEPGSDEPSRGEEPNSRASHFYKVTVLALAGLCIAVLIRHAIYYLPYCPDDAFISFRYSKRLLQGLGLTWTDGERVEGYTNFLWVLLVAAGGIINRDLVVTARVLGVACMSATIGAMFYALRGSRLIQALPPAAAAAAFALSGGIACYAIAGLEPPLVVVLLIWGVVLTYPLLDDEQPSWRKIWPPGLLLGLCCTARADAALLVGCVGLALVIAKGFSKSSLLCGLRLGALPALCYGGQLVFRRIYYEAWVPNTAKVKVAFSDVRLEQGLDYIAGGGWPCFGLLVAAVAAIAVAVIDRRFRGKVLLTLLPLPFWCAYLVSFGGDNMPLYRHLVPLIALLALTAAQLLRWLVDRNVRWQVAALIAAPLMVAQIGNAAFRDKNYRRTRNTWAWPGQPIGLTLKHAFLDRRPLMAVDAAGVLPFYAELPALDMLGLNDRYIAEHPPPDHGSGQLAHELGDGPYVLGRKPDLIIFGSAKGHRSPLWRSGQQMVRLPDFHRYYQLVTFATPRRAWPFQKRPVEAIYTSQIWVRKEDSVVGIQRSDKLVSIPGYLLGTRKGSRAQLDDQGRIGLRITRMIPAMLTRLHLPRGLWRAKAHADSPVRITVWLPGGKRAEGDGQLDLDLAGRTGAMLTIQVRPQAPEGAHLEMVEFEGR